MKNKSAIMRLLEDDPCSVESMSLGGEFAELIKLAAELEDKLTERLKGSELADIFNKFSDVLGEIAVIETDEYFKKGIKFGVKFGMEIAED